LNDRNTYARLHRRASRFHGSGEKNANVDVGVSIDRERFIEIMHESLR
jgi:hypothetical protein